MTPEKIPVELRERPQWVCWRYEKRDGKRTKAPIDANSNGRLVYAKSNDPSTWASFATAQAACGIHPELAGVGFCFAPDDGLTGIDMDHVLDPESGEIKPAAVEILQRFADTYAEISPSGTGLRIFCYGKPKRSGKNTGRVKWLEVYSHPSSRYLTVTSNHWNGNAAEVTDQQAALDWLHDTFMVSAEHQPVATKTRPADPSDLDDMALLDKAHRARNGGDFARLWNGDTSAHDGDDSAADLALCNHLAFWTNRDPSRMDKLFRQSGLMRPKWDEVHHADGRTYGQGTIVKAIESTRETYRASSKKNANPGRYPINSPLPPLQPLPADFSDMDHDDTGEAQVTNAENQPVTSVTESPICPFFVMKYPDGTLLTKANHDTVKQLSVPFNGLWYVPIVEKKGGRGEIPRPEHGDPVWLSIPFELLATTDDGRGHGHGLAIRFCGLHGYEHTWTIPRSLLVMEGRELFVKLYEMGFHMATADSAYQRVRDYLNKAHTECANLPQALSVARTGWAPGNRFVLPDKIFGDGGRQIFFQSDDPKPSVYTQAGSLEEWRTRVARPVAPYDIPVFALACAFAGPLLDPLAIESGGFHFEGLTSTGKTSAQYWALSVWGEPREVVQTWEGTRVGFELVAAAYSDTLMVLDEIGRVDPRIVGTTVYQIMNGSGKLRGNARLTHRATLRWRTLLLSSGEKSLAQIMAGAPGSVPPVAGQEVRLAHIPIDPETGIFNGLTDAAKRRALVKEINDAAGTCYGHAARAFLEKLTADGLGDALEAAAQVKQIAARLAGDKSTNEIDRVALRFALVGFAGELASQFEITGWPRGRALNAATALFKLWRNHWGSASRDETNFLQRLDEWLAEHRPGSFAELDPVENRLLHSDRNPLMRSFYGYTRANDRGRLFYLNRAGWRALTQDTGRGVALSALRRMNRLVAGSDGDGGKQVKIAGENGRYYIIHGEGAPDGVELG